MLKMLVFFLLLSVSPVWAVDAVEVPPVTASQLDDLLAQKSAQQPSDATGRNNLVAIYSDIRSTLDNYSKYNEARQRYAQARIEAHEQARAVRSALVKARVSSAQKIRIPAATGLSELENTIQNEKSDLESMQNRLAVVVREIDSMPARADAIRARLTEISAREAEAGAGAAEQEGAAPGSEAEARLWLVQTRRAALAAEKAALREELISQPMRLDLLKAQQDKLAHDISVADKRLQALLDRAAQLRQSRALQAQVVTERMRVSAEGKSPLVLQLADDNARLASSLGDRSRLIESARLQESDVQALADRVENDLSTVNRMLEILGMTSRVGQILREQGAQLPKPRQLDKQMANMIDQKSKTSLRLFELTNELRELRDLHEFVETKLAQTDAPTAGEIREDMLKLAETRRDLVRQALDTETMYSQVLGDLDLQLRRYATAVDRYRHFISERLLWIPSGDILSLLSEQKLSSVSVSLALDKNGYALLAALPAELFRQPITGLLLLVSLVLIFFRSGISRRLRATAGVVGRVRVDNMMSTVQALGWSLLFSLRWPLVTYVLINLLGTLPLDSQFSFAADAALIGGIFYWWALEMTRILLLPGGVVAAHFRWPARRTDRLYQRVARLEKFLVPGLFAALFFNALLPRKAGGLPAMLAVIVVLFALAYFFRNLPHFVRGRMDIMLLESEPDERRFFGKIVRQVLVWLPLAGVLAALCGFTFTVLSFVLLLLKTVTLCIAILLAQELGLRWLRLTRRRMRLKERLEHMQEGGGDRDVSALDIEPQENDTALLTDEGTRLLSTLLVLGGLLGLVGIWSSVLPALSILDAIELWHYTAGAGTTALSVPVTLADLISALFVAIVGWIALRRIPGLLDMFLRQKLNVSPGTAYAASRIMQYAATIVLVVWVLNDIGGSWSQIQWAVAALSVGIGFGLQEIVANFISGLIILFEQPIRVGDTVTVGEVSGTVTKIRIRATTIRDWERRELLVPNKEFVTGRLLNWSLSDEVTRLVVQVGVAYGTDVDQAIDIVRAVATDHPSVLAEPEPLITFDEFGDNSLLITLRFFLDRLDGRIAVASDVRLEINRRFNAAGIVVAFPQRDVHLDTTTPLAVTVVPATDTV